MKNSVKDFWRSLAREQKVAVGLLSVCGIAAIVLAFVEIRRTLVYPFTAPVDKLAQIKQMFGPTDQEKADQQKRTDTDGDGISDWDELNVYHTSPYLSDTDGDGIKDNIEIAKGTDPNCPQGKVCYQQSASTSTNGSLISLPSSTGSALPLKPDRTPAAIRQYLQASGMSAQEVSGFSDQQLLDAYDQSNASFQAPASSTSSAALPEASTSTMGSQ
ncbi:MAG: hypothetical protein WC477_04270 [Patescibacteria group bacterium]